jgi:hypothetical protein
MSSEKRRSPPQELTPNRREDATKTTASSLLARFFGRVSRHMTEWPRLYVDQQAALYEPSQQSSE